MSDTMRRIQLYKKTTTTRSATAKFQRIVLKHLIQHNKRKRDSK